MGGSSQRRARATMHQRPWGTRLWSMRIGGGLVDESSGGRRRPGNPGGRASIPEVDRRIRHAAPHRHRHRVPPRPRGRRGGRDPRRVRAAAVGRRTVRRVRRRRARGDRALRRGGIAPLSGRGDLRAQGSRRRGGVRRRSPASFQGGHQLRAGPHRQGRLVPTALRPPPRQPGRLRRGQGGRHRAEAADGRLRVPGLRRHGGRQAGGGRDPGGYPPGTPGRQAFPPPHR